MCTSWLACSCRQPCEPPGVPAEAREMYLTAWMGGSRRDLQVLGAQGVSLEPDCT